MKYFGLILLWLFVWCSFDTMNAQEKVLTKIKDISLKAEEFIGVDKFDNLYTLTNNTLFKKTENGQSIAFQDVLLGDIDRVDILNPNKIIVFYKMSNTVVILDNRMTEIDRQDFNRLSPFKNVSFAGTSKDQGLWIYNIDVNQLELYDYRYDKTIAQSLPIDDEVLSMKNNFNYCFLETEQVILVFNIYGSLVKTLTFNDITSFNLYKNRLIVHSGTELSFYDDEYQFLYSIKLSEEGYKNFFYKDENLYLYDGKFLSRYSINSKN